MTPTGPRSAGATRAGPDGPNEDALHLDDERCLYGVADGVGQHRGAGVASALVLASVADALAVAPTDSGEDTLRRWLGRAAGHAARVVHARGRAQPDLSAMGTTLTALQLVADAWWIVHVGDTRAYVLRDGQLQQLTRDHSVGWEQFEAGAITKEQLRTHPNQNLLTRSVLARRDGVVPDVRTGDVHAGDRFLLCSDGLLKVLDEGRIAETLGQGDDPAAIAQALVERAARLGLVDDTTVVVMMI